MDIPKSFMPEKLEEMEIKDLKKRMPSMEDLIIDEGFLGYDNKTIHDMSKYLDIHNESRWIEEKGVNLRYLEKMIIILYENINKSNNYQNIFIYQYKTKNSLTANLKGIFEKGMKYSDTEEIRFAKRFFFKDKTAVFFKVRTDYKEFVKESKEFVKKAGNYYRGLGFKQLDFKIVEV